METTTSHEPDRLRALPPAVEARIDLYARPARLDAAVVAPVLPRLKELTRLAAPKTPEEAKGLLSAGCRLIADTYDPTAGPIDLHAVLREDVVARWSHAAQRSGMAPGSIANYLRFLNRLVRASNGLPPRTRSKRTVRAERPVLASGQLLDLAHQCTADDRPAAAALVAAAGAGVLADSTPVTVDATDTPVVVQDDRAAPVSAPWRNAAAALHGVTADPAAWRRLRAAATAAGLDLSGHALRLRWALDAASEVKTPQEALSAMSRSLLDAAIPHLAPTDGEAARVALRGR